MELDQRPRVTLHEDQSDAISAILIRVDDLTAAHQRSLRPAG